MKVKGNQKNVSINHYLDDTYEIWKDLLKKRTSFDIWLHVYDKSSQLAEAVRTERPKNIIESLAKTFMWYLSFVAHLQHSTNLIDEPFKISTKLSDIIWNKYPGICPACLDYNIVRMLDDYSDVEISSDNISTQMDKYTDKMKGELYDQGKQFNKPTPCGCLSRFTETEERHSKYKIITEEMDYLRINYAYAIPHEHMCYIDELGNMFEKIFGNTYKILSIENIAFHLLEEIGEVSKALIDCYSFDPQDEKYSRSLHEHRLGHLEEELADVASWMYALFLKIKSVYYRDAQEYFQSTIEEYNSSPVTQKLNFVEKMKMSHVIWSTYAKEGNGLIRYESLFCYKCQSSPCKCEVDLRIDWLKTEIDKFDAKKYFYIYYHADFDGIVSASLLSMYLINKYDFKSDKIITVPVDFNEKASWSKKRFNDPFAIVDFLYHPDAVYWFDHHVNPFVSSEFRRDYENKNKYGKNMSWSTNNDSASSIIYTNLISGIIRDFDDKRIQDIKELVHWADIIDSAKYSNVNEWYETQDPATQINLVLLYKNDPKTMNYVVKLLTEKSFLEIIRIKSMKKLYDANRKRMDKEYKKFSEIASKKNSVVHFDISNIENFKYHRFFSYKFYDSAKYTIGIYKKGNAYEISVGKNPWLKTDKKLNIGLLCGAFYGGGHEDVGGITLSSRKEASKIAEIVKEMLIAY